MDIIQTSKYIKIPPQKFPCIGTLKHSLIPPQKFPCIHTLKLKTMQPMQSFLLQGHHTLSHTAEVAELLASWQTLQCNSFLSVIGTSFCLWKYSHTVFSHNSFTPHHLQEPRRVPHSVHAVTGRVYKDSNLTLPPSQSESYLNSKHHWTSTYPKRSPSWTKEVSALASVHTTAFCRPVLLVSTLCKN